MYPLDVAAWTKNRFGQGGPGHEENHRSQTTKLFASAEMTGTRAGSRHASPAAARSLPIDLPSEPSSLAWLSTKPFMLGVGGSATRGCPKTCTAMSSN